jgi:hypothetical protein
MTQRTYKKLGKKNAMFSKAELLKFYRLEQMSLSQKWALMI